MYALPLSVSFPPKLSLLPLNAEKKQYHHVKLIIFIYVYVAMDHLGIFIMSYMRRRMFFIMSYMRRRMHFIMSYVRRLMFFQVIWPVIYV